MRWGGSSSSPIRIEDPETGWVSMFLLYNQVTEGFHGMEDRFHITETQIGGLR